MSHCIRGWLPEIQDELPKHEVFITVDKMSVLEGLVTDLTAFVLLEAFDA
jgi:hypothetical protein